MTGTFVVRDPSVPVAWERRSVTGASPGAPTRPVTALSIGAVLQQPLVDTNDRMAWGFVYLVADTSSAGNGGAAMVLDYSNTTRAAFATTGLLPSQDNSQQPAPLRPAGQVGFVTIKLLLFAHHFVLLHVAITGNGPTEWD